MLRMFGPRRAHRRGDVGVEAAAVVPLEREAHDEALPLRLLPVDLEPALGLVREEQQVRAVGAVDAHPAPARDVADDRVARHRLAALGVADHQPVDALDAHALRVPRTRSTSRSTSVGFGRLASSLDVRDRGA